VGASAPFGMENIMISTKAKEIARRLSEGETMTRTELQGLETEIVEQLRILKNNCSCVMKQLKEAL